MNDQIKRLAVDAGFVLWEDEPWRPEAVVDWSSSYDNELKRFAELIVRECLEQIYSVTIDNPTDDWDQGYDSGLDQAAETIKTHFGVEE